MANSEMDYIHGYAADQTYDPTSMNAQSGIAVSEAVGNSRILKKVTADGVKTWRKLLFELYDTLLNNVDNIEKIYIMQLNHFTGGWGKVMYKLSYASISSGTGRFIFIRVAESTEIAINSFDIRETEVSTIYKSWSTTSGGATISAIIDNSTSVPTDIELCVCV